MPAKFFRFQKGKKSKTTLHISHALSPGRPRTEHLRAAKIPESNQGETQIYYAEFVFPVTNRTKKKMRKHSETWFIPSHVYHHTQPRLPSLTAEQIAGVIIPTSARWRWIFLGLLFWHALSDICLSEARVPNLCSRLRAPTHTLYLSCSWRKEIAFRPRSATDLAPCRDTQQKKATHREKKRMTTTVPLQSSNKSLSDSKAQQQDMG